MAEPVKVLVIDDEPPIRRLLRASLPEREYELESAETGQDGIRLAATSNPGVILLDLGLPDIDGVEVARRIREWSEVPIIVLSARGKESDKVLALDAGADDYLTKPFGVNELLARLRVALRHAGKGEAGADGVVETGRLRIDLSTRRVYVANAEIRLTPNEYKLLAMMARHPGLVLTHKQLLTEAWGPAYSHETHYLRVYMAQLRHKIEEDPARPKLLRTEPGVGYRLLVD